MKKVPKLRFKEFTGEWEEKRLGDIAKFSKGKLISKEDIAEIGIECIRYGELYTTYKEVIDKTVSKTNLENSQLVFSEKNDIIIPSSGETAIDIAKASCVIRSGIALGGDLNILKTLKNGIFLSYYMNNKLKYQIASLAQGASVVHLYENHLKLLKLNIPESLEEQEKIANFISSVDKKISLTEEKLELFKNYKKGIMQKIFSQKLRFKDENGNDYPEWEEIEIGKILTERKEYSEKNENYPHFSLTKDGVLPKSERYERDFLVKDDEKMYKITHLNDICYNPANLKFGVICKNNLGSGIFSPIYITFIVHKGVNANYLDLYIKYSDFIKRARKYEEGTVYERMAVKCSDFIKVKVNLPCLEEQEKIANFLSSIDEKIEKIENEVENLKEFKKGLLQRLFV